MKKRLLITFAFIVLCLSLLVIFRLFTVPEESGKTVKNYSDNSGYSVGVLTNNRKEISRTKLAEKIPVYSKALIGNGQFEAPFFYTYIEQFPESFTCLFEGEDVSQVTYTLQNSAGTFFIEKRDIEHLEASEFYVIKNNFREEMVFNSESVILTDDKDKGLYIASVFSFDYNKQSISDIITDIVQGRIIRVEQLFTNGTTAIRYIKTIPNNNNYKILDVYELEMK